MHPGDWATHGGRLMESELSTWTKTAWKTLSELPASAKVVADRRRRWDDLQSRDGLRTVIFGAYDAGKSTLLKRLLVESGTNVPKWLTVSGRRETFEVRSVQSAEIVFVDTPGLSGGNDEHERISRDEMQLADAYLWVLPPQLVTANKQEFLDFASGRHFGDGLPVSIVAAATIGAIARMDEAGIDPADNPDGFRELAARKADELRSMLHAGGVEADLRAVLCVAADPYQMVGANPAPERELYDYGRDWDGVAALTESLRSLCAQRESLRAMAGARFVAGLARDAREELATMIAEDKHGVEVCANEIEHHRLSEQRLKALRRQAAAEFHRRVEDELLHAGRVGSESVADVARTLEDSLSRVVDEWSESCFADYRGLAAELEFEVRERMDRPSFAALRRFQGEEKEGPEHHAHTSALKTGKRILGFGPELRTAFGAYARSQLGMDLKTAADRLQELETSGQKVKEFIAARGQQATFRGVGHADQASRLVAWGRAMDAVGPLVVELGGMLFDVANEAMTAHRAKERAQRRADLMKQLRRETEKIETQAGANFEAECAALQQWLHARISTFEDGHAGLKQRIEKLRTGIRRLDEALQDFPN